MEEQFIYSAGGHRSLEDFILNSAKTLIEDMGSYILDDECSISDVHSALDRLMALTDIGAAENSYLSESAKRQLSIINQDSMVMIRNYNDKNNI
ncbi:hypothetical protein [Marinagarivorans cellulosilyticus]|uniref:hypothetical protein n=1 Tax=Marinagarivorans cellulosilyticus TaxID=2721545 RepID=UPI001F2DBA48|nr:hypothetical protein [Marinagarivorans cellulosilyticus]